MLVNLTQKFIDTELKVPEGKSRVEFCDSGNGSVSGLYALVSAQSNGTGSFYLRYKDKSGKTAHKKIERTTDISLVDARKQAKILKAEIALGGDPRAEQKKQREALTWNVFFDEHYLPYVKPRKRSWKRDEELNRLRIEGEFGNMKLNALTRLQIQSFHTSLLEEGLAAATANHHIKLMKHALNLAIDWGMLDKNPAARIPLFLEDNMKENYLSEDELEKLLTVLRNDENRPVCLIVLYLLSTGARLNEALSARWEHINREQRVWRIPASNSKSKRVRSVPLNDSALEVLNQLDTEGKFQHLFVNKKRSTEKEAPYTTIAKVWDRIRKEAGVPHLRIHDCRHLFASWLVCSGRPIYEVMTLLGHANVKTTQRYSHLSSKTLQNASDCASAMIKGASVVLQQEVPALNAVPVLNSIPELEQPKLLPQVLALSHGTVEDAVVVQ